MICKICQKEVKRIGPHTVKAHNVSAKEYYDEYIVGSKTLCKKCGINEPAFININLGYKTYCSRICAENDIDKKERRKKTCIRKYGVDHPSKSPEIVKKIQDKRLPKQKEITEKVIKTHKERYGGMGLASDITKEKVKKTMLKRYGVDNSKKSKDIQDKFYKTMIERYGAKTTAESPILKRKMEQTCLEKYGTKSPAECKEVRDKMNKTMIDRYGSISPWSCPKIRKKIKNTMLEKYGVENPMYLPYFVELNRQTRIENGTYNIAYSEISQELFWKLYNILKEYNFNIYFAELEHDNKKHPNYEYLLMTNHGAKFLDFYIKDLNLCIEFQSEYWHDDKDDLLREYAIKEVNPHIEILYVDYEDYIKNKDEVFNQCLCFIKKRSIIASDL